MKKSLLLLVAVLLMATHLQAQVEPAAGNWKTWFISSGKAYRLPSPPSNKEEIAQVLSRQQELDSAGLQQILFWNAGSPGYRWHQMISKLWVVDTAYTGVLANMLLNAGIYDATVAAWDTKYAFNRERPFAASSKIKAYAPKPESPSYPCEHSVAAGVASTVIAHFYPALADSVNRMAQRVMESRVAAGVAFPSDTKAGFELGRRIALKEIEHTKGYSPKGPWDGKMPQKAGLWNGKKPMFPMAGKGKTVVLDSSSQFRPGPPPDFAKDMAEMKAFKPTFRSQANAFYYASQTGEDVLHKKIFEYNLHQNPPQAARVYALTAVASYDAFIACWDAKYAYWGIRPNQYDTTYHPLIPTPPFPGYPSGHAVISGVTGELYSYFFPADRTYFQKRAKDGAESRFQAGIHFRTDNEVGLEMGRKIANAVIQKARADGAENQLSLVKRKPSSLKPISRKTP
ncbi:phosphatase PAP2 family protein [Rufibacter latericius]|uniref:Phosphatase PAP2 family protein n=1 Tax=Rufibacter latericius TaxID=2487040 RepID=A0A3M9MZU3_9BACT|nr:phosphatase PAP2 family protein [Rufibacter latericius]RNI31082.1 phosphatase PAP2 family protein [Rufibacter latericius]